MNILLDIMSSTKLQDAMKVFKDVSPYLSRGIRWINSNNIAQYADLAGRVTSLTDKQQEEILGTVFDRLTANEELVGQVVEIAIQANDVWTKLAPLFENVKFNEIWAQIAPLLEKSKLNEIVAKVTPLFEKAKPVLTTMSSVAIEALNQIPATTQTAVSSLSTSSASSGSAAPITTTTVATQVVQPVEKAQTTKTEAPKKEQEIVSPSSSAQMPSLFAALGDLGSLLSASFSQVQGSSKTSSTSASTSSSLSQAVVSSSSFLDEIIAQMNAQGTAASLTSSISTEEPKTKKRKLDEA